MQKMPGREADQPWAKAWDCHVHVFDPSRHGYTENRSYTPGAATIDDLEQHLDGLGAGRAVIVQPSPYGTDNGCLLEALAALGPERARGVAVLTPEQMTESTLADMHASGVRGLRCNFKTAGENDVAVAAETLQSIDRRLGDLPWFLQAFVPFAMTLALGSALRDLSRPVVLDHFGGLQVAETGEREMDSLLDLLRAPNVMLKLSGAHRTVGFRQDSAPLAPIIRRIIDAAPKQLIWGTDWPHTGPAERRRTRPISEIEPFENIDDRAQLRLLSDSCSSANIMEQILVHTPDWLLQA